MKKIGTKLYSSNGDYVILTDVQTWDIYDKDGKCLGGTLNDYYEVLKQGFTDTPRGELDIESIREMLFNKEKDKDKKIEEKRLQCCPSDSFDGCYCKGGQCNNECCSSNNTEGVEKSESTGMIQGNIDQISVALDRIHLIRNKYISVIDKLGIPQPIEALKGESCNHDDIKPIGLVKIATMLDTLNELLAASNYDLMYLEDNI